MEKYNENNTCIKPEDENKKNIKFIIIIILLILLIIVLAGVAVWAIVFKNKVDEPKKDDSPIILAPDYAPQEEEKNAEEFEESGDTEKLEQPEGGGGVGLEYTKEATISLKDKSAKLYFANPGRSNQDMIVQMVIQDNVIIQSGRLKPGMKVSKLDLIEGAEKQLKEGTYEGKYVILFYQQDTGEKAILNTEIPITITVKK